MEAVNSITMFSLNGVERCMPSTSGTASRPRGGCRAADSLPEIRKALSPRKNEIGNWRWGCCCSIAAICSDARAAINEAGRVLVNVGLPEKAGPSDPEKLKEAARRSGPEAGRFVSRFRGEAEVHRPVGLDVDDIVEVIFGGRAKNAAEKADR
jgi:hypothetical protein